MPSLTKTSTENAQDVPEGFLDRICVLPSFYMPETEDLKITTHNNIKRILFFHTWRSIKYVEFQRLNGDQSYFDFGKVSPAQESWLEILIETYISKEKNTGKLLETTQWEINRDYRGTKSVGKYKVKVYHMDDDEFRAKCYPSNLVDAMRYLWFNRSWFRIL